MTALHIARRELGAILGTTIGWLVLAGFLLVNGVFFVSAFGWYSTTQADVMADPYAQSSLNLGEHLLAPWFANTSVVLILVCPALSMRLFAEERRQRTLELLLTSPVSTAEIVVGKFLGALTFVAVLLAGTLWAPLLLWAWSTPDLGIVAAGYLALLLVGATSLAMGSFMSSLTDSQVTALVLTVTATLFVWVLPWLAGSSPDGWLQKVGLLTHVQEMMLGAIRASDLAYFASFIGVSLFGAHQRVEAFRWS